MPDPHPASGQHPATKPLARRFASPILGKTLLIVVFAMGALLRIVHYVTAGSLWHDEACLALNILQRNFLQLLRPLHYDQAAPIGYLWLEKTITLVLGSNEPALRLASLVASLAVLVLLPLLSKRLFGTCCAIIALSIVACSPLWIYYAAELKPYSLDAALALWILLCFEALASQPSPAKWTRLFASAALALFLSQTIILILLPVGIALAVVRRGTDRLRALALVVMSILIAGGLYLAVYRAEANQVFLKKFWVPYELLVSTPGLKTRLIDTAYNVFFRSTDSMSLYVHTVGVVLLAVLGLGLAVARAGRLRACLLVSPFALLLLASSVGAYPIAPRTILFALPLLIMLVALPLAFLCEWIRSRGAIWGGVAFGLLILAFTARGALVARSNLSKTFPRVSRQAIAAYESARNCNPVYIFSSSLPVWEYYTTIRPCSHCPSPELVRRIVQRNHRRVFLKEGPLPEALAIQTEGCRPLLFGELPPEESQALSSYDWASAEMHRIASTGARQVYVFGELFAPSALSSLANKAVQCGGSEKTLLGEPGRGYLGELVFPGGNSCR